MLALLFNLIPAEFRIAAALGLALLAFAGGFSSAWQIKTWQAAAAQAETLTVTRAVENRQIQASNEISAAAEMKQVEIREVIREVIKEIPVYVTKKSDAHCVVPRGFVRLHDRAAGRVPEVPGGTGQSDDAPSGLVLSAVGGTIADNYGACREAEQRLIDLQAWVREMATQ